MSTQSALAQQVEQNNEIMDKSIDENEEDTKIDASDTGIDNTAEHEKELDDMMKDLYYIYHKHSITGPFEKRDILRLYVTSKISGEIWVKSGKYLDEWVKLNLSNEKKEDEGDDKRFKETLPDLYNYLMPKISLEKMKQIDAPFDIPPDAAKKLSVGRRMVKYLGFALDIVTYIIVLLHVVPFLCVVLCLCIPVFVWVCKSDDDKSGTIISAISFIIGSLGLIITPIIIVYAVLLGAVDADYWNGEIQSWMIGYIAWGICSFLLVCVLPVSGIIETACNTKKAGDALSSLILSFEFWILGVDFGSVDLQELMGSTGELMFMVSLIFPCIASLLPATIIGFIANFALEEKFELKCNNEIGDTGICYNDIDGSGCCEVISSHDISNTYTFVGGLASNILATWAVIRICGFLLVSASNEASVFAKRNK